MSAPDQSRKLAAILAADVVGYSRLMAADEAATVRALNAARDVFRDRITHHGGRLIDTAGDSVLAEFRSVVEAVRCAVAVQDTISAQNTDVADDRKMRFRIGVNLGDIIEQDDGTIYGDGVNVAARLEALADPGGVMLSDDAFRQVDGKVDLAFADAGSHVVKNIAKPVRAYRVVLAGTAAPKAKRKVVPLAAALALLIAVVAAGGWYWAQSRPTVEADTASVERMAFPLPDKPSIVVLPLDSFGAGPELERLADGLSENITASLSHIRGLFVVARNSAFTYKDRAVKVQQVAEELGVRYVLEGSLQAAGDKLRVTAQLIDALSGDHVWSDRYDRAATDIFEVQDDITLNLVNALQVALTEGTHAASWLQASSHNLEAWRLFWQGYDLYWQFTPDGNARARELFEKAVALDPGFQIAAAYIGWTHALAANRGYSGSRDESLTLAESIARRLMSIDEPTAWGYDLLGWILVRRGEYDLGIEQTERALALSPNDADILGALAENLLLAGRYDDALTRIREAMRLNPYYPPYLLDVLADILRLTGRYEDAIAAAEEALPRYPESEVEPLLYIVYANMKLGKQAEARTGVTELLRRDPTFSVATGKPKIAQRQPYRDPEVLNELFAALSAAGLPKHPPGAAATRPSIAVLPFDNLSGDPEQDYFAAGLTDEIITELGRFNGIAVVPYAGANSDARAIGEETSTAFVVNGSVRKAADTIRVTTQLIDAVTGAHLWAETYERALTAANMFAVQDEVTQMIVATLADAHGIINRAGLEAAKLKRTQSLEVYDCILRDNAYRRMDTPQTHFTARACLERAVELDPGYAETWARLSHAYVTEYSEAHNPRPDLYDALERGHEAAQRAVELDPVNEVARLALARAYFFRHEPEQFFNEAGRAVELNPNNADVIGTIGMYSAYAGKWERGLALLEQAMTLSPFYPGWYHFPDFFDQYRKGEYEAALAVAQKINMPDHIRAHALLAAAYGQLERADDARPHIERILALDPNFELTARENRRKFFHYQEDLLDRYMDGLRKAGLAIPEESQ